MAVTNYIWDMVNDNVLAETDENDEVTVEYTCEPDQFGNLISQERDGVESFYHFDGQGSTRALTDENGDVTDTYTYSAFGEEVSKTGTTENPYRYVGEKGYYFDEETEDYYVRRRVYEAAIGRWTSVDPVMYIEGPNGFVFVRNSPPNNSDASGLLSQAAHGSSCIDDCGVFVLPTKWIVEAGEQEGFIMQRVCRNIGAKNCDQDAPMICTLRQPSSNVCQNTRALPAQKGLSCYHELWRVHVPRGAKKATIIAGNPYGDPPGPAVAGDEVDLFAQFGCRDECAAGATFGRWQQSGEAFFIASTSITAFQLSTLQSTFQVPPNGVRSACNLASGTSRAAAALFSILLNKTKSRKAIKKTADVNWNCCDPCACPEKAKGTLSIGTKAVTHGDDCSAVETLLGIM